MSEIFDVFVIGAGVAGLAAADAAARSGLKVCVTEELLFGGLVVNVNHLTPAPAGLPACGSDLAAEMMTRVADLGVTTLFETVTALRRDGDGLIRLDTPEASYSARFVIVASGARLRQLGVPGEAEFEHRGVSHCADCDAPMFRGQTVVVVGGGDSALQEALVLDAFCSAVHLVHRGSGFSARPELVAALGATSRITVHMQTVVEKLEGADALTGALLRYLPSGKTRLQPCKGFFPFIGLDPYVTFLPPEIALSGGAVRVDASLETSIQNVFAIGAVRSGHAGLLGHALQDARDAVAAIVARSGGA